jgi:hypothetical protein
MYGEVMLAWPFNQPSDWTLVLTTQFGHSGWLVLLAQASIQPGGLVTKPAVYGSNDQMSAEPLIYATFSSARAVRLRPVVFMASSG